MRTSGARPWLRGGAVALTAVGISLLAGVAASVVDTRSYQARQGRAFSRVEGAAAADRPLAAGADHPVAAGLDPLVVCRIEIPRIGVTAIVREGDDDATLAIAVGHVPHTAAPGERGNMALAGHRDSFFRGLRGIRVNDSIQILTPSSRDDYIVDWTEVVGPNEVRVLAPTTHAVLTLVTCYPFGFLGRAPNRFIVRASLVSKSPSH